MEMPVVNAANAGRVTEGLPDIAVWLVQGGKAGHTAAKAVHMMRNLPAEGP